MNYYIKQTTATKRNAAEGGIYNFRNTILLSLKIFNSLYIQD